MNCPNCGTELPEGSVVCTNCAASLVESTIQSNDFNQASAYTEPPKKSKKGLIIGLSCAAVAIIAIVVIAIVLIIGGNKNGTYTCKEMESYGVKCTLKVNGDKFTLKMSAYGEEEKESGKIKFKGKKVTLTVDGEDVKGTYNKSKKTIDIEGMTFTKK